MSVTTLERKFVIERSGRGNIELRDPDPTWEPEKVRDFFMNSYPEITNSEVLGPDHTEKFMKYTFKTSLGSKG